MLEFLETSAIEVLSQALRNTPEYVGFMNHLLMALLQLLHYLYAALVK